MFEVNDVVRHILPNSPPMSIFRVRSDHMDGVGGANWKYLCRWFDAHGVMHEDRFASSELRPGPEPKLARSEIAPPPPPLDVGWTAA